MTKKKVKVGNVPNLRFPGFEGEWEEIKLADITKKINSGKTPLGGESVYLSEGIVFIRSQNVNNEKLELENPVYISEEVNATMKNSVVKPNDILLNITGASLGRSCVVPDDFALGNVNQHVCIIRLKENYNPRFLQSIFSSAKGQSIFESLQTGSGREGLNFDSIKKIILKMPVADEQLRIASFLSLLNKRIETQNKIIQQLETLMRILGEKLFTQKCRFKDNKGNDFPDWVVKKLGEVASIRTGSSNREDSILNGAYVFFDRSQDVRTSHRYLFDKEAIIVPGEGQEFSPKYYTGKFDLHQRTYAIFDFLGVIGRYLYYHIRNNDRHLQSQAVGSTVKSLRLPIFQSMPIKLPNLEEQNQIATLLSSIDKKITIEKTLLEKHLSNKKHLLANLFI